MGMRGDPTKPENDTGVLHRVVGIVEHRTDGSDSSLTARLTISSSQSAEMTSVSLLRKHKSVPRARAAARLLIREKLNGSSIRTTETRGVPLHLLEVSSGLGLGAAVIHDQDVKCSVVRTRDNAADTAREVIHAIACRDDDGDVWPWFGQRVSDPLVIRRARRRLDGGPNAGPLRM